MPRKSQEQVPPEELRVAVEPEGDAPSPVEELADAPMPPEAPEMEPEEPEPAQGPAVEITADVAADMLLFANNLILERMFPGRPMTPVETAQLREATAKLVAFYADGVLPEWLALWLGFAGTLATVYGVRYYAAKQGAADGNHGNRSEGLGENVLHHPAHPGAGEGKPDAAGAHP